MEGNIKKIILEFENCDSVEIPGRYLGIFRMKGIKTSIGRMACNFIGKHTIANHVFMEIFSEANKMYKPFGQFENMKIFDRITSNDITHITLIYDGENVAEDGEQEIYVVPYDEGKNEGILGAPNIFQKVYLSKLGNLYMVISPKIKLKHVFPKKLVDNEEWINMRKSLQDIVMPEWNIIDKEAPEKALPAEDSYVWLQAKDGHTTEGALKNYCGKLYWQTYKANYDNETEVRVENEKRELNTFVAWRHK